MVKRSPASSVKVSPPQILLQVLAIVIDASSPMGRLPWVDRITGLRPIHGGASCRVAQARQSNDLHDIEGLDALFAQHRDMPTPLVVLLQGLFGCNLRCNQGKPCPRS